MDFSGLFRDSSGFFREGKHHRPEEITLSFRAKRFHWQLSVRGFKPRACEVGRGFSLDTPASGMMLIAMDGLGHP
jgi:hypothetical protein